MKIFSPQKFDRTLRLGTLLLLIAAAGMFVSFRSLVRIATAPSVVEGSLAASLASLAVLITLAAGGASVIVVAALARFRSERLQRGRTELALSRFRQAADASSDLITIMTTSGRIEYVNEAVERVTGYRRDELVDRRLSPRLPWYGDAALVAAMLTAVRSGEDFVRRIDCRTRAGGAISLDEQVKPFRNGAGEVVRMISTARDATAEQALTDRIDYLDRYDELTGLPNRRTLLELLDQDLAQARASGAIVSTLVLAIDRFRNLDDLCGTGARDEVVKMVSARLRASVSPADITARTDSDEFVVVHIDSREPLLAGAVAQKLRTVLAQRMTAAGQEVVITVSIGIASFPVDGDDAWTLLKNADLALARAQSQGRNGVQFFDRAFTDRVREFFILEKCLFSALRNNEYLLQYQPYCDLQSRKISGAEALIRWKNPDLGVVSPARFIPSLEDTGMVIEVGRWILETACGQIKEWERANRHFPVSVNLSLVQFRHQHLVPMVREAIDGFRLDPRRLTLEVTETVFMHDMEQAVKILKRLKDVGVALSVDDFGTGYSSLSYIKRLPVDNLKIDISFVRDVTKDQDAASIITAITTLARSLNLKTIAEGVETEEQRNILHLLRCDMGQGYYFSKAVSAEDFGKLVI